MNRIVHVAKSGEIEIATFEVMRLDALGLPYLKRVVDDEKVRKDVLNRLDARKRFCLEHRDRDEEVILYMAVARPGGVDGMDHTDKGGQILRAGLTEKDARIDGWTRLETDVVNPSKVARDVISWMTGIERLVTVGEYVEPGKWLSVDEVEAGVMDDYRKVAGKVVHVDSLECLDAEGRPQAVKLSPPVLGRISSKADLREQVLRWSDETHCDPVYPIEILEPHAAFDGLVPHVIYGTSRSRAGKIADPEFWVASDEIQRDYRGQPGLAESDLVPRQPSP